ncbi:MAG TPA: MotA/TolQ/ExbB proton channel family protein [Candidatus Sulfotelmatobacter sp.]|jgi:biopolymer transport protein ExbB/TolQ|nr:MotA/TolQ/ExbB proton channel family protein [Candidatus Sulfotelmatobacter sp.]
MPQIDLSVSGLFLQATGVVQGVLAVLLLCSVWSWAIILDKVRVILLLRRDAARFEVAAKQGRLDMVGQGICRPIAEAGREEAALRHPGETAAERHERIETAMRDTLFEHLTKAESRLPYLATIGSSAPFIGLFGTVWGIMHSFAGIAQANDTSLAVVAPGIAEALSTTAIGLAAAIPASVAYNKLSTDFSGLFRRFSLAIGRSARQSELFRPRAAE